MNRRINKPFPRNPPLQEKNSPFAPRPFVGKTKPNPLEAHRTTRELGMTGIVQRKKTRDYGGVKAQEWYQAQIEATGTAKLVSAVAESMSEGSGVFLSDDLNDWQHWLKLGGKSDIYELVIPDRDAFQADPDSMPDRLKNNGMSVEKNCELVAEHELVHLKHSGVNLTLGNHLGADTQAASFGATQITDTVDGLIG